MPGLSSRYILSLRNPYEYLQQAFSDSFFEGKITDLAPDPSSDDGALFNVEIDAGRRNISEIIERMVMAGIRVEGCYSKKASLDEIFARIVE